MQRRLQIDGFLTVSDGERNYAVTAAGTCLVADIGEAGAGFSSWRRIGVTLKRVRRLSRELERLRLTLVITRRGAPLAEIGAGVRAGFIARLFGFPHVRFLRRRSQRIGGR